MARIIKNIDSIEHVWCGQSISSNDTYTLQSDAEAVIFSENATFLTDLANGLAEVYQDSTLAPDLPTALNFLKNYTAPSLSTTLSLSWTDVKAFCTSRSVGTHWVTIDNSYSIYAFDGPFSVFCKIPKDGTAAAAQADFETNFKNAGNKKIQPVGVSGSPIVEQGHLTGAAGSRGISLVTPNLADRTTWYQKSVKVTAETLVDSGDGLTFTSANAWWVDILNKRLTYTHKQIPKRDGTYGKHADWLHSVTVNGSPTTSFTTDFEAGTITFSSSQSGNTVAATYWHTNGVSSCSEWLMSPPSGKKFIINNVEIQYSMDLPSTFDTMRFEVWAGGTLAAYSNFSNALFDAGYGQFRADYRSVWDFLNATNNQSSVLIPKHGDMVNDVFIMPFNYTQSTILDSAMGVVLRLCLVNDTPLPIELASATFYIVVS